METHGVKWIPRLILVVLAFAGSGYARAQWTKVNSSPNASTCLLLTDGTVMCQAGE